MNLPQTQLNSSSISKRTTQPPKPGSFVQKIDKKEFELKRKAFKQSEKSSIVSQILNSEANLKTEKEPRKPLALNLDNFEAYDVSGDTQETPSMYQLIQKQAPANKFQLEDQDEDDLISEDELKAKEAQHPQFTASKSQQYTEQTSPSKVLRDESNNGLQSFYLCSNVRTFVVVDDQLFGDQAVENESEQCISLDLENDEIRLFQGENYKTYQSFEKILLQSQKSELFKESGLKLFSSDDPCKNEQQQNSTTILSYGQQSSGKSKVMGTLWTEAQDHSAPSQESLIFQTLQNLLQLQRKIRNSSVIISCYEIVLNGLNDLFDEYNDTFMTEGGATWLQVQSLPQIWHSLQQAFLNRKQKIGEDGVSRSQSHLVVNLKLIKGQKVDSDALDEALKTFSFLDLVGFNESFSQKIIDEQTFRVPTLATDESYELAMSQYILESNDKDLYSIWNLIIEVENQQGAMNQIETVLDQTTLVRVVFTKLIQSGNFLVVGCVKPDEEYFNETLNTLEFLEKIKMNVQNQVMDTDEAMPTQNNPLKNQSFESKMFKEFYRPSQVTNLEITKEEQRFSSQTTVQNQASIQRIKINSQFLLSSSFAQSNYSQVQLTKSQNQKPKPQLKRKNIVAESQKSTGFATNTQLTCHQRKVSQIQDKTPTKPVMTQSVLFARCSDIKQKSMISSFISGNQKKSIFRSSSLVGGALDNSQEEEKTFQTADLNAIQEVQEALQYFQKAKNQLQVKEKQTQQLRKQKVKGQESIETKIVKEMIRDSLNAVQVQLNDFSQFILGKNQHKRQESCLFNCTESNNRSASQPRVQSVANPLSLAVFKRDQIRFFDSQKFVQKFQMLYQTQRILLETNQNVSNARNDKIQLKEVETARFGGKDIQQAILKEVEEKENQQVLGNQVTIEVGQGSIGVKQKGKKKKKKASKAL